ncbi:MAG: NUDIX domain-containing protein [Candidatus Aenigmarchaeota archaeon]|nr:NUDIX domain-containing protein [Candidatus Aenigmarchaeota archaeon]
MAMGDEILVVSRDKLLGGMAFEGFLPIESHDFCPEILGKFEYRTRTKELETDDSWQQPIPYVWVVSLGRKEVFLYVRSRTGGEGRLFDKYSGGVGGHIDKSTEELSENPLLSAMMRELKEEVKMEAYPNPRIIGFINFNDLVEAVHFGVVALADTDGEVSPLEDMAEGRFYSLEEAEKILSNPANDVERWTLASWPKVKEILEKC